MEDRIYISNLKVQAIIGIFGWERKVRQEISIDLEIALNSKKAAETDAIEDTFDYKAITKAIIAYVESSSFQLQETLAEGIAALVKRNMEFPLWGLEFPSLELSGMLMMSALSSIDNDEVFSIAREQHQRPRQP